MNLKRLRVAVMFEENLGFAQDILGNHAVAKIFDKILDSVKVNP